MLQKRKPYSIVLASTTFLLLFFIFFLPHWLLHKARLLQYVHISNYGDNTVSIIDTATNAVIKNENVGTNPYGVAVTRDGKKVYVTNDIDKTVSVIDISTNNVLDTVNIDYILPVHPVPKKTGKTTS